VKRTIEITGMAGAALIGIERLNLRARLDGLNGHTDRGHSLATQLPCDENSLPTYRSSFARKRKKKEKG